MTSQIPNSIQPKAIGQYTVLRTFSPGRSFLAQGIGRPVVIKMLDSDCLVDGRLHPNIHDRLARVRELAHIAVANLHGVERQGDLAFAVWEYVDGDTFDRHAEQLDSAAALARLAREVILAVEALHALGIVHGRIHSGNVIVDRLGLVRLTHVSPLLYDDPRVDARDLSSMLGAICARRWPDSPLARLAAQSLPLSQLRAGLGLSAEGPASPWPSESPDAAKAPRRMSLVAAAAVVLAASALAASLIRFSQYESAQKPVPPEATPRAMQDSLPGPAPHTILSR
jgi:hypothetical protein